MIIMNKPILTDEQMTRITSIVEEIEKLSDIEKLLLYLHLPGGTPSDTDIKTNKSKNSSDLFGKKADQEITQTYTWILSHLEEDSNVSLPKQEVYDEYRAFCEVHRFEPLCVADFGKAMKHAFPRVKPRRLGQRGSSRYCYSGLRKKYSLQPPSLPSLFDANNFNLSIDIDLQQKCDHSINNDNTDTNDKPSDSTIVINNPLNSNGVGPKHFLKIENVIEHEMQQQSRTQYTDSNVLSTQRSSESSSMNMSKFRHATSQLPCTPDDDDYHHYHNNNQLERMEQQQQQFSNPNEAINTNYCCNVNDTSFDCPQNNKTVLSGSSSDSNFSIVVPCNMNISDNDQNNPGCVEKKPLKQLKKKLTMKRSILIDEANNISDLLAPTKKMYIKSNVIERQSSKSDINSSENYRECHFSYTNCNPTKLEHKQHTCRDEHYEGTDEGLAELREILEKNLPQSQLQPQSISNSKNMGSVLISEHPGQLTVDLPCFDNGPVRTSDHVSFHQINMQQFTHSQMSPTSINESHGNSVTGCSYDHSMNSLATDNSTVYMHNNLTEQPVDQLRFVRRTRNEDDDVSLHSMPCITQVVNQDQTFAMAHDHIIQDSPLNSTYSTPAEHIPLNTLHSQQQHSHISECQLTDASAIDSGNLMNRQSPIYRHPEQEYSQAVHNNNDYSNISDRHMNARNSYVPSMENNSYQRFYYSQQSHHQALCSPFVSPSSTPNPFTENYDQHDAYHLPMFND